MAIHDAYARITPFERLLPSADFADERFPDIEEEAAERGVDLRDPTRFPMLMAVGEALREIRAATEDPVLIRQHGRVLFQSYHFWKAGRPVHLAPTEVVRRAVDDDGDMRRIARDVDHPFPLRGGSAAYLQLPQHLVWSRPSTDASPESVDGAFWTAKGDALAVLVALGVRPDRPGFSVVDLPPVPLSDWSSWVTTSMREEGDDFSASMPGADLDGLYEIRNAGELLKLLTRIYRVAATPDDTQGEVRAGVRARPDAGDPESGSPPPSAIPYACLRLRD